MTSIASETSERLVEVSTAGAIGYVTLNRPRVLNALNHDLRVELIRQLGVLNEDDTVRVVVLRGSGTSFCAGQDQRESAGMAADGAAQRITDYGELFQVVREMKKPTIARLEGYAAGAGLQLALHCDLRIASETAQLGMTELAVGSACITGSIALTFAAGIAVTRELIMLGGFIPAGKAHRLNLITEVCVPEELDERITNISSGLADSPPLAIELTKRWWRDSTQEQYDASIRHAHEAHAENYASGNLTKAAEQFVGKRK